MSGSRVEVIGALARDARQHDTEFVSVREWRTARLDVPENAWVLVGTDERRNHILLQAPLANVSDIIISHTNDATTSNNPASDLCGLTLRPGASVAFSITPNLPVYARVQAGGTAGRIAYAEMF